MGLLNFPTTTAFDVGDLWLWTKRLVEQLDRIIDSTIHEVTIRTTETAVAHGKPFTPSACLAIPRTNVAVWQSRQPDEKCCYFTAASSVVVDVRVFR